MGDTPDHLVVHAGDPVPLVLHVDEGDKGGQQEQPEETDQAEIGGGVAFNRGVSKIFHDCL